MRDLRFLLFCVKLRKVERGGEGSVVACICWLGELQLKMTKSVWLFTNPGLG